jgi:hypothetical protein
MKIERELMRGAGRVAVLKLPNRRDLLCYELAETAPLRPISSRLFRSST